MNNLLAIKQEAEKNTKRIKAKALEWLDIRRKSIQDDKFSIKKLIDSGIELAEAMELTNVYSNKEREMFKHLAMRHLNKKKKAREKLLYSLTNQQN